MRNSKGFTLIELSIVLVIVGLLIGGILVAQTMVGSSKLTATIQEIQQHYIETQTFKLRYNYLPGDVPNNSLGTYCGTGTYGDGNGIMDELSIAWAALNLGLGTKYPLIGATCNNWARGNPAAHSLADYTGGINVPKSKVWQNMIYVWEGATASYPVSMRLSADSYDGSAGINTDAMFTAQEVGSFDTKLDDGLPDTGTVTVAKEDTHGGSWTNCRCSNWNCYNNASTVSQCSYSFRVKFTY